MKNIIKLIYVSCLILFTSNLSFGQTTNEGDPSTSSFDDSDNTALTVQLCELGNLKIDISDHIMINVDDLDKEIFTLKGTLIQSLNTENTGNTQVEFNYEQLAKSDKFSNAFNNINTEGFLTIVTHETPQNSQTTSQHCYIDFIKSISFDETQDNITPNSEHCMLGNLILAPSNTIQIQVEESKSEKTEKNLLGQPQATEVDQIVFKGILLSDTQKTNKENLNVEFEEYYLYENNKELFDGLKEGDIIEIITLNDNLTTRQDVSCASTQIKSITKVEGRKIIDRDTPPILVDNQQINSFSDISQEDRNSITAIKDDENTTYETFPQNENWEHFKISDNDTYPYIARKTQTDDKYFVWFSTGVETDPETDEKTWKDGSKWILIENELEVDINPPVDVEDENPEDDEENLGDEEEVDNEETQEEEQEVQDNEDQEEEKPAEEEEEQDEILPG